MTRTCAKNIAQDLGGVSLVIQRFFRADMYPFDFVLVTAEIEQALIVAMCFEFGGFDLPIDTWIVTN